MVFKLFFLPAFLALTSASAILPASRAVVASGPAALLSTPVLAKFSEDTIDPNPSYSFAYDVQDSLTGDSKGHIESRANGIVQGQYNVAEPDGTRRIVDYSADAINGFNAIVRNEPLIAAAQPVIDARAAKVISAPVSAPLVARTAPLVAKAAPIVAQPVSAQAAPYIVQSSPYVAQASPYVAQASPYVAQTSPYVAQAGPVLTSRAAPIVAAPSFAAPLVARSNLISGSPYFVGVSGSLLGRSFNAPLTYAVV